METITLQSRHAIYIGSGLSLQVNQDPLGVFLITGTHTHTYPFNGPFFRDYPGEPVQKGKTNLDFTEARDSEWQWNQLGHMQVCTSLQTDNHASMSE